MYSWAFLFDTTTYTSDKMFYIFVYVRPKKSFRDRGAALRLGGGGRGGTISDSILGGTRHFFLLILYNFKNIGGGPPYSAVPVLLLQRESLFLFLSVPFLHEALYKHFYGISLEEQIEG